MVEAPNVEAHAIELAPAAEDLFLALENYIVVEQAALELTLRADRRMREALSGARVLVDSSARAFGRAVAGDCRRAIEDSVEAVTNFRLAELAASEMRVKAQRRLLEQVERARDGGVADELCAGVAALCVYR